MTAGLLFGALGGWLLLACLVAPRIGRLLARAEQVGPRRIPVYPPPVFPPVPLTQAQIDATWLADQPTDVWLTDSVVRDRLREIERQEGWAEA